MRIYIHTYLFLCIHVRIVPMSLIFLCVLHPSPGVTLLSLFFARVKAYAGTNCAYDDICIAGLECVSISGGRPGMKELDVWAR